MHYLLLKGTSDGTRIRDIVGSIVNQTTLCGDDIGNIEFKGGFVEVEIFESWNSYNPGDVNSVGPARVQSIRWEQENWERISKYIRKNKEAVQHEREEEMKRHQHEIESTSGRQREKKGRALLHIRGKEVGEDLGGKTMVKFSRERKGERIPETEISVGDLVMISKNNPMREDNPTGTVAEQTNYSITVAFEPPVDQFLLGKNLRVDLYVNDITYQRMLDSLEKVPFGWEKTMVEELVGISQIKRAEKENFELQDNTLEASQRRAVQRALNADSFFCIHGPPGTGKTTTLASLIEELAERNEKVLATAASNTATDNMVEFLLGKDLQVLRIGHPARVTPYLRKVSLDYRIQKNSTYKKAMKLKDKAEELQKHQKSFQVPSGKYRRGMSDEQIHQLAKKGAHARGVSRERIEEMSRWLKLQEKIDLLYKRSKKLENKAMEEIIKDSEVICTTNSTAGSELLVGHDFDVNVIDEATQATEPSCLIPGTKASRVILAGDHKQLPPTILSQQAEERLQTTMFERLLDREGSKIAEMLLSQFRMHKDIMEFSNRKFYGGELKADPSVANHTLSSSGVGPDIIDLNRNSWLRRSIEPSNPLVFLDTQNITAKERQRRGSHSRENPTEKEIIEQLIETFLRFVSPKEVGVITPYDDQAKILNLGQEEENLEIQTVDGFQGREKEIILISFVRSNPDKQLGFLTDERRLNVSLTRARKKLVMVGDSETLSENQIYRQLVEFVQKRGTYLPISTRRQPQPEAPNDSKP